jgi:hypothetical protein
MEWKDLIGPAVVAAVVSGIVSLVGNFFSSSTTRTVNLDRIAAEKDSAERKFTIDVDLAERRFKYEQTLHAYKRRVEFAEEVLASFYKVKDVLHEVRGPMSFGEGAIRKREGPEIEGESRSRDSYYVPIARLKTHSEFLSEMFSKKHRAQAIFQNDIHGAFEKVGQAIHNVRVASSMLVQNVGQPRNEPDFWRGLERDIWEVNRNEPDGISQMILDAIQIVEAAVRPTLEASRQE